MIQILLIEENTILKTGIKALFTIHPGFHLLAEARSVEEAVTINLLGTINVIITDASSSPHQASKDMEALLSSFPEAIILIFTWPSNKESAIASLEAGAANYMFKDISGEELLEALKSLVDGKRSSRVSIASTRA